MEEKAEDRKFYWLKLKRDFFKRHDIRIIEEMPNGKDYILFYLKLLCESVDHDGNLRFNEEIPYNEEMLSTITHTNIDIVRSAIKVFTSLKMIDVLDNGTFFMEEVNKMMGTETYWAERKRVQRLDKVQALSSMSRQEIELELDKESDKEIKPPEHKKYDFESVINYMNIKCHTRYDHKSTATQRLIRARYNESRTLDDFKKVIDIKSSQWLCNEKMVGYLRPSTLFNQTKFENYLNEAINYKDKGGSNGSITSKYLNS